MKVSVVTSFSPKGYEVYGRKMIASFVEHWPEDATLYVFHEGKRPDDANLRAVWVPLESDHDWRTFTSTHTDREDAPGDYRFRVVRYCHKVFAQTAAPRRNPIIWLDGDTVTTAKVTHEVIANWLPSGNKLASYLGRPYFRHTETGFIGYGTNAGEFLDEMRRIYMSDEVLSLPEWHDCMVFDHARVKFERKGHRFQNLCPTAIGLNVFEQSPLAPYLTHYKGPKRKSEAYGDSMAEGGA